MQCIPLGVVVFKPGVLTSGPCVPSAGPDSSFQNQPGRPTPPPRWFPKGRDREHPSPLTCPTCPFLELSPDPKGETVQLERVFNTPETLDFPLPSPGRLTLFLRCSLVLRRVFFFEDTFLGSSAERHVAAWVQGEPGGEWVRVCG